MHPQSLVAKRISVAKLRSAVVKPKRRIQLIDRKSFKRVRKTNAKTRPIKSLPKLTPQQRRELVESIKSEEDDDILN